MTGLLLMKGMNSSSCVVKLDDRGMVSDIVLQKSIR